MRQFQRFTILIILIFLINTSFVSANYFVKYTNQDSTRKFIIVPGSALDSDFIIDDSVRLTMEEGEVREYVVMANREDEIELLHVSYKDNEARFSFVGEDTPILKRGEAFVFQESNWTIGIKEIGSYQCSKGNCDFVTFYIGMKAFCGDEWCNTNENPNTCPLDCPTVCGDDFCSYNEDCKVDGCCGGDKINLKMDIENCGECGLECESYEECDNGVCLPVCGDGYCIEGETCLLDNCCDGAEVDFDNDADNCGWCGNSCADNERCGAGKCVTYCGNGICDDNENCESCVQDCGCKHGFECYQNECVESGCLSDLECDDNNACTMDSCSGKPKACFNEQIKLGCSINNECVPVSTRIDNLYYCNADNAIGIMETTNSSCAYDYQCQTNLCKENKCKQPNMIIRMLNWFKNLF